MDGWSHAFLRKWMSKIILKGQKIGGEKKKKKERRAQEKKKERGEPIDPLTRT
jgi:hypothetical protein